MYRSGTQYDTGEKEKENRPRGSSGNAMARGSSRSTLRLLVLAHIQLRLYHGITALTVCALHGTGLNKPMYCQKGEDGQLQRENY